MPLLKLDLRSGCLRIELGIFGDVTFLSELVVGVCLEESYSENYYVVLRHCWWILMSLWDARRCGIKSRDRYRDVAEVIGYAWMLFPVRNLHDAN